MPFPAAAVRGKNFGFVNTKNVFDIDFEDAGSSPWQFDSVVNPDADLTVDATGKMGGTDTGLSVEIDDQTAVYCVKNVTSPSTGKFRVRFYIDPNSLTMGGAELFGLTYWYDTSGPALYAFAIELGSSGAVWALKLHHCIDGGYGGATQGGDLSDAAHYIEIYIQQSSSAIADDGRIDWWIDGAAQTAVTGIDNYDLWDTMDVFYIGAYTGVDAGTSGTFFLDEIAANDSGAAIGA